MIVISFYTINTPYEIEVQRLQNSLRKLEVPFVIEGLKPKATWVENCALKANFVQNMLQKQNCDMWWLDADAVVVKALDNFCSQDVDIAAHFRSPGDLTSSAVFFRNNSKVRQIIDLWADYCEQYPLIWDQVLLSIAIHNTQLLEKVSVYNLPSSYSEKTEKRWKKRLSNRIKGFFNSEHAPFIRQNMASRRFKSSYKRPPYEVSFSDLPIEVLQKFEGMHIEPISPEEIIQANAKNY